MNFIDFYGKYWTYSNRQWRNLGIKFQDMLHGLMDEQYLIECFLDDDNTQLGYALMFQQIMFLKRELNSGNWYIGKGMKPELIYDTYSINTANIKRYLFNEMGELKPSIRKRPVTHIRNCYKTWLNQLMYKIAPINNIHRAESNRNAMYERTVLMEPEVINTWIDKYSEQWINEWVYEPDMVDNDEEEIQEIKN